MEKELTANTHIYRDDFSLPCEKVILSEFIKPGMRVLDVGCASSGRSARVLRNFGAEVYAIEINHESICEFSDRSDSHNIELITADMTQLPFKTGTFDMVLIAYHGIDYLHPESLRIKAIQEAHRLLKSNGFFVFNTLNPIGVITSPRSLFDFKYFKWRLKQLLKLGFLKKVLFDSHGLKMYQSIPKKIISQVKENSGFHFLYAISQSAITKKSILLTMFSSGPYYVFSKIKN